MIADVVPGCREDQDRVAQKWMEEQTKYEDAHLGNFRRIYPSEGSEKYDKFFHSSGSLYQETASFKARSECARSVRLVKLVAGGRVDHPLQNSIPPKPGGQMGLKTLHTSRVQCFLSPSTRPIWVVWNFGVGGCLLLCFHIITDVYLAKSVATRWHLLRLKCTRFDFGLQRSRHLIPASDAAPRHRCLRSAKLNCLTVPSHCRLSTYGCRPFHTSARQSGTRCLMNLETRDSFDSFKQFLKTILFSLH